MRSRRLLVMAVLLPVSLALAACTSEEKPGAAKATYIAQSDTICTDVFSKSASIGNAKDQATAEQQSALWADAFNRLDALQEPQESVELARQFVTITDNLAMSYTAAARAQAGGDQAKANKAYTDIDALKKQGAAVADEYGYEECVNINGTVTQED